MKPNAREKRSEAPTGEYIRGTTLIGWVLGGTIKRTLTERGGEKVETIALGGALAHPK
jgi:hypothetical protein